MKKELLEHLRRTRVMRRSRHHTLKTGDHGRITDAVSISERPATAADRAVPGHWEGDLLCGSGNSQIATLVERQTRYVMLVKLPGKDTETVVNALIKHAHKLPHELYKSLTWDRGKELADHKRFTLATDIKVYFCDPQNPWQRGTNENTNGLLRQYFPKGTSLSVHSQAQLNAVARRLNERPRKTLNFETPAVSIQVGYYASSRHINIAPNSFDKAPIAHFQTRTGKGSILYSERKLGAYLLYRSGTNTACQTLENRPGFDRACVYLSQTRPE